MDKIQKRAKKNPKSKKKYPIKVVYITNPIKFKASASEFRALVQELTGQDAAYSSSASFSPESGGGGAVKVSVEGHVHAESNMEGFSDGAMESFDDSFVSSLMIESFQECAEFSV